MLTTLDIHWFLLRQTHLPPPPLSHESSWQVIYQVLVAFRWQTFFKSSVFTDINGKGWKVLQFIWYLYGWGCPFTISFLGLLGKAFFPSSHCPRWVQQHHPLLPLSPHLYPHNPPPQRPGNISIHWNGETDCSPSSCFHIKGSPAICEMEEKSIKWRRLIKEARCGFSLKALNFRWCVVEVAPEVAFREDKSDDLFLTVIDLCFLVTFCACACNCK